MDNDTQTPADDTQNDDQVAAPVEETEAPEGSEEPAEGEAPVAE
jgi:hypothetical protein